MLSISKPQTNLIYLSILVGRLDLTRFSIFFSVSLLSFSLFELRLQMTKPHITRLQEGCKETSLDIWLRRW
jgi:hypothetical protein